MSVRRRRLLVVLAVCGATLAAASFWGREWLQAQAYFLVLDSEDRVQSLQIDRVVASLGIESGDVVADIGAGTGLFIRPLSPAVGTAGRVYAVDVNETLLEHLGRMAVAEQLANVQVVRAAKDDPLLPGPVDLVLLCDTLHHIENPDTYVRTLRRYLRPDGKVAIIDFERGESPHLMPSMRYSRADLESWMKAAGYELVARHDYVEDNFFLIFRCPDCSG